MTSYTPKIHYKDSQNMKEVKDCTVRTIVTSPPYWDMYYYGHDEEIGYGQTYEKYLDSLDKVWEQCYKKLVDNGTLWVNVSNKITKGKFHFLGSDFANRISDLGFILQNVIIWYKPNAMPILTKNKFTNKHEYLLFFSKTDDYKFYKDRVRIPQQYAGVDWGGRKKMNPKGKDPGNVWRYSPKKGNLSKTLKHPAPFPTIIPEMAILTSSDENEIILDPFAGTGTSLWVSKYLKRKSIGYEINKNFKTLIHDTISSPHEGYDFLTHGIDGSNTITSENKKK
jgi:site-specific DNA-methyltransferase (adenine-specific)